MSPISSTHSSTETDPDYKPEIQLRSPTKNEDSVNCHPWNTRGRRLFPQRRPSLPTSISRNVNVKPGSPPFETSPPSDHSPINHQEYDSNTSSPDSVDSATTVKVRMSPSPDRPFPETDSRVGEVARVCRPCLAGSLPGSCSAGPPIIPYKSSNNSLETSLSAPLYTDTPARGNLQWTSMAQFHKSGHRLRPRTPSQLPNGEQMTRDSDKSQDALVRTTDTFKGNLPIEIVPCKWSQSPGITPYPELLPIEAHQDWGREEDPYVVAKDLSRPNVPTVKIATWDCTVKLSTVATVTGNGRLHIHHLALLSVIMPREELYAEKVSLSFVVTNALRNDHKSSLGPGQSSLLFKEDVSQPGFFPREGAELVIVRDSCDLEKPLNLYFAFTYPSPCHFGMASLPTFRPKEGRSLSEVVFIAEPLPPLSMRTFIRDPLSSWKLCHHPASQVTCYERIDLPRLYPAGFQDDIQMRILELESVRFLALGESTLSSVVWKLDITVHELPEEQLECRISFFLEVGAATALVSLVSHGWVPRYFIVDGRIATEKVGGCWENKEGHITIFKQAHMGPGPIMIETYWQGPPKNEERDGNSTDNSPLPRVADRKVLGGRLTCQANKIVLLNHVEERIRPYGPDNGTYTLLPTMDAGYMILLKRVTKPSEHTVLRSDAEVKMDHGRGLSHIANDVKGEAAPKRLLQAMLPSLLVLLLLVPGFLLFVGHVRKGNNHNERTSWREMSRDGERPQTVIDWLGLDPLQPDVAATDKPIEVAKCEGWRDWVDYGSGWNGCIP
ncbi:hypothetical protein HO173_003996 [Letharia columbiana]|uniref:Uncharacterized protein n=1 Tax=Letharia columbiana TaxID=112416 RepID=A0A8H6FZN9_9LECA|nr:uncharacterized protein HO173_003996 [Letharia columbiana]KAF6237795.1 hypothetical protein HO173_003996 [Letharia columbiana]